MSHTCVPVDQASLPNTPTLGHLHILFNIQKPFIYFYIDIEVTVYV